MRVDMNVAVEEWEENQGVAALRTGRWISISLVDGNWVYYFKFWVDIANIALANQRITPKTRTVRLSSVRPKET